MGISVNASLAPPAVEQESRGGGSAAETSASGGGFEALFASLVAPALIVTVGSVDTGIAVPASATPTNIPSATDMPTDLPGIALSAGESGSDLISQLSKQLLPGAAECSDTPATDTTLTATIGDAPTQAALPSTVILAMPILPSSQNLPIASPTIADSIRSTRTGGDTARAIARAPTPSTTTPIGAVPPDAAQPANTQDSATDASTLLRTVRAEASALASPVNEIPMVSAAHAPASALPEIEAIRNGAITGDAGQSPVITPQASAPVPVPRGLELKVPPSSPVWREAFSSQVNLLIGERVQSAQMRLHPPELGPVDIRISITEQQTTIAFTAAHEDTRRAIEDAMPRLREVLAESGVQLGHTSVEGERTQDDGRGNHAASTGLHLPEDEAPDAGGLALTATLRTPRGLIDTFA